MTTRLINLDDGCDGATVTDRYLEDIRYDGSTSQLDGHKASPSMNDTGAYKDRQMTELVEEDSQAWELTANRVPLVLQSRPCDRR